MTQEMTKASVSTAPLMNSSEKMRLRAAAFRAKRVYPGPVGELCSREILTWEEFGYRLGGGLLIMRMVDHILKMPMPQPTDTKVL